MSDQPGEPGRPSRPSHALVVHVDVTDTVRSQWTAGIQRVVRQLVRHLDADPRITLVPIVWSTPLRSFRLLTPHERALLREAPVSGSTAAAADDHPLRRGISRLRAALRWALVRLLGLTRTKAAASELLRRLSIITVYRHQRPLTMGIDDMPPGSVLLELDAVWNVVEVDRDALYGQLRARGVRLVSLVYDLLPQRHPEWFEGSVVEVCTRSLTAQVRHSDDLVAISEHTRAALKEWAEAEGVTAPDPLVVRLGADGAAPLSGVPRTAELPHGVPQGSYVLVVGTVEPRKNHRTLLDAFERLRAVRPEVQLVVVGRPGWCNDELVERLLDLHATDPSVHWLRGVDDQTLAALYAHAFVVAVPSVTEGYGLPVIEALGHGVPVVSSSGGSLPEAGGDLVDYVDPLDVDGWVSALRLHLEDPAHHARRRAAAASYRPPGWNEAARQLADAILGPAALAAVDDR
jgi:glycosyltransferase involved in cell wall biosynthesis